MTEITRNNHDDFQVSNRVYYGDFRKPRTFCANVRLRSLHIGEENYCGTHKRTFIKAVKVNLNGRSLILNIVDRNDTMDHTLEGVEKAIRQPILNFKSYI